MTSTVDSRNTMKFEYSSSLALDRDQKLTTVRSPRIDAVFKKVADGSDSQDSPEVWTEGLVDSGADMCMLPRKFADELEIDLAKAARTKAMGADGMFPTYRTKIHLEIIHDERRVQVGMVDVLIPEEDPRDTNVEQGVLLGRKQLFMQYEITFNEAEKTMLFKRNDKMSTPQNL